MPVFSIPSGFSVRFSGARCGHGGSTREHERRGKSMSDLNHIATVAARAADAASEVLMRYFGNATVQTKGLPQDLVTQADLEAERTIVGVIREAFTDHS